MLGHLEHDRAVHPAQQAGKRRVRRHEVRRDVEAEPGAWRQSRGRADRGRQGRELQLGLETGGPCVGEDEVGGRPAREARQGLVAGVFARRGVDDRLEDRTEGDIGDDLRDAVACQADLGQVRDGGSEERTREVRELEEGGQGLGEPRDRVHFSGRDRQQADEPAVADGRVPDGIDAHFCEQPVVRVPGPVDPGLHPRPLLGPLPQGPAALEGQVPQRHGDAVRPHESQGHC